MNLRLFLASALIALLSSGCAPKDKPAAATTAPTSVTATAEADVTAAAAAKAGPRVVEITGGDNMKFNLTTIQAKPGEQLKVVLTNVGTQPKEVMGHNWVL